MYRTKEMKIEGKPHIRAKERESGFQEWINEKGTIITINSLRQITMNHKFNHALL